MTHLVETEFWGQLMKDIYGPRKGGAWIIIDAEWAKAGVGKTGLACALGEMCAYKFGWGLSQADGTLSGEKFLDRVREHPGEEQPSVILWDEAAGAGSGNARRAMSAQNVELGDAAQLVRKKRIVMILTLTHWSRLDSSVRMQSDYRLNCQYQPLGYFTPYMVGASFDSGDVRTHGFDDVHSIEFPDMKEFGDPLFEALDKDKDELLASGTFEADEVFTEEEPDEEPEEDQGPTPKDLADQIIDEDRIEEFTSVHAGNKMEFINQDLIRAEFGVSLNDAKQIKALLERAQKQA